MRYRCCSESAIAFKYRKAEVVILGAGMAGLSAAYELEKRGHTCVILSADRRHIGGRVRTLRFEDGLYGDAGAIAPARNSHFDAPFY